MHCSNSSSKHAKIQARNQIIEIHETTTRVNCHTPAFDLVTRDTAMNDCRADGVGVGIGVGTADTATEFQPEAGFDANETCPEEAEAAGVLSGVGALREEE